MEKMEPSRVGTERMLPDEELLNSVRPYSVRCSVLWDTVLPILCFPRFRGGMTEVAFDLGEMSPEGAMEGAIEGGVDETTEGGKAALRSSKFHSGTSASA
jgi:hypothetical protein